MCSQLLPSCATSKSAKQPCVWGPEMWWGPISTHFSSIIQLSLLTRTYSIIHDQSIKFLNAQLPHKRCASPFHARVCGATAQCGFWFRCTEHFELCACWCLNELQEILGLKYLWETTTLQNFQAWKFSKHVEMNVDTHQSIWNIVKLYIWIQSLIHEKGDPWMVYHLVFDWFDFWHI